jgi:hypothetical protein
MARPDTKNKMALMARIKVFFIAYNFLTANYKKNLTWPKNVPPTVFLTFLKTIRAGVATRSYK